MFASVLFFGGISTKFDILRVRMAMIALAIIIFATGLITLATFPIY
jgi:hypothetical protein